MKNRPMFFFAPDTGGNSGAGVIDQPSTGGDSDVDPLNYVPPSTDEVQKFVDNADDPKDAAPVGSKKKGEEPPSKAQEKKPDTQEQKKPDAAPAEEREPASKLRARLKELEGERDSLKGQLDTAKTDRRVDELTAKIAEKDKSIEAAEKSRADYEQKLLVHNPLVSKKLVEMRDGFNKEYAAAVELVPSMAPRYRGLLEEFEALPRGTAEYAEALKEFKGRLRDDFDDDMPAVFDALRKGVAFKSDHARAADEIQRDAARMEFEGRQKSWSDSHASIEKDWGSYFEPPADAEANDPYNHNLFLKRFEEAMPKDEVEKINRSLKAYVSGIFNGPQPRTKSDFPGMDDAAIQKEMASIEQRSSTQREESKRVVSVALKFLTLSRPFLAEFAKMRQRVEERSGSQPPDPTGADGARAVRDTNSVENYEFPSPEELERRVARG